MFRRWFHTRPNRHPRAAAWLCWAWLLCGGNAFGAETLERYEFLQIRMGIPFKVIFYAPDTATANLASRASYERVRQIDRIMSDYDPDSELMRLCTGGVVGRPMPVSRELMDVLSAAEDLSRRTSGAFDVTVGPVVKLWRVARRRKGLPDQDRLSEALKAVGYQFLELDREQRTVTLLRSGMSIDLGAIAKGYAADEALRTLAEHGIRRALIDAGGDVVIGDPPPGRDHWTIEIEKLAGQGDAAKALQLHLKNAAVATSGDAYQYVEIDGIRYSHLIDPKTGLGLTTPGSVTVIAPTGMQADSLASAVSVVGIGLIEDFAGTEAYVAQQRDPGIVDIVLSSGFHQFVNVSNNP